MGTIWFLGFIGIIVYRCFDAGRYAQKLFYTRSSYRNSELEFSVDRVMGYAFFSVLIAIFWLIILPVYGIYRLGQKFGEKK